VRTSTHRGEAHRRGAQSGGLWRRSALSRWWIGSRPSGARMNRTFHSSHSLDRLQSKPGLAARIARAIGASDTDVSRQGGLPRKRYDRSAHAASMLEPPATMVSQLASRRRVAPGPSVAQAPSFSTVGRARTRGADLRDDRHGADKHTCISTAMRSSAWASEGHPEAESVSCAVRLPRNMPTVRQRDLPRATPLLSRPSICRADFAPSGC
jgi:hypothetical protein